MKPIYLTVIAITVLGQGCATTSSNMSSNSLSKMRETDKKYPIEKIQIFRHGNYIKTRHGYYITDLSVRFNNKLTSLNCNKSLLVADLSKPRVPNKKVVAKQVTIPCREL